MTQGFLTIATGHPRYYQMARNLLRSYRQNAGKSMRFAVIADRENEYTAEFDDVVILPHASNSWADKLELLKHCPYDENIFLDADCLVYQDINFFWDLFSDTGDFSCFGKALPLGSQGGWFTDQASEVYPIHFLTHLHGMLYFIRRGETVDRMYELCQDIVKQYHKIHFKYFNDCLADEPVFALAMAVLDLKPVERVPEYYCFVPALERFFADYLTRRVSFAYSEADKGERCCVVHWGNVNTKKADYRLEVRKIEDIHAGGAKALDRMLYRTGLLYAVYRAQDSIRTAADKTEWFVGRVQAKLLKRT